MDNQKIKIRLKSFDHGELERAAEMIVSKVALTAADINGPIPLPRRIERFTVNTSPHIDKKAREQYEIRRQSRIIIISFPTAQTIEALKIIELPKGVEVQIKLLKISE